MTIYRWSFETPFQMRSTDIQRLIRHIKDQPATEVQEGTEVSVTPPFFNGEQTLFALSSPRSGEGVIGRLTIRKPQGVNPFLVVRDYQQMDEHYGPDTVQFINRDNPLAVILQGDGGHGILVHSVIAYSPKGESEGFWQRKR